MTRQKLLVMDFFTLSSSKSSDSKFSQNSQIFLAKNVNLQSSTESMMDIPKDQELNVIKTKYPTPAPDYQLKEIKAFQSKLSSEFLARDSGLSNDENKKTLQKHN